MCEIAATHGGLVSAAIRIYDPDSGMLEPYCGHGTLHGNFGLTAIPLAANRGGGEAGKRSGIKLFSVAAGLCDGRASPFDLRWQAEKDENRQVPFAVTGRGIFTA